MHEPPLLVIMAKAPVCGAVKTRLASEIGAIAAAALTRTLTEALLREVAGDPRFRTLLAISPDQASCAPIAAWRVTLSKKMTGASTPRHGPLPAASACGCGLLRLRTRQGVFAREKDRMRGDSPNALRVPQGRGGLGQRMQRIFDACGRGPLIIVGTDIPFVTREIIADAFRNLRRADAVFGRAEDGGYWLVGLRRRLKRLAPFGNVRWSSPHALADTLRNLRSESVAFAATLFDIDTEADYRRYLRERNAKARYAP
ncbi:MAG TPA: TIGR04282 family arsenosugar biosynthesis glycosyltransferase [Rhodomicrobium sp.]|nr:TIGR04282 family arsenosugar biosynthesis glycosyltransferase [Rhodomicrobium sp.]